MPPGCAIPAARGRADRALGAAPPPAAVARPDRFDPERFLPDAEPPARFSYLPFGAGPRACIGAQFALTETVLVLARLVQAFRIELADQRPVLPLARITLQPDRSPPFRLRRR